VLRPRLDLATNQRRKHPHRGPQSEIGVVNGPQVTRKQNRAPVRGNSVGAKSAQLVGQNHLEAAGTGRGQRLIFAKLDHTRTLQKRASENKHQVSGEIQQ
jgi:hypothetical protein